MYILDFLKGQSGPELDEAGVIFDYRLLCSGELYNECVQTFDWRKSDATRVLVEAPFSLAVCSRPFHEYPQELALRFSARRVTEQHGHSTSSFFPDEDIARDIAALLTLFWRRLVTVAAKIREVHPTYYPLASNGPIDCPIGFIKSLNPVHWEYKPSVVIYRVDGPEEVIDYNPPPLGVNPEQVEELLKNLPALPLAESVILSARLYSLALVQLERDIDLAYQLLIAAVEATATEALRAYSPSEEQMIASKASVLKLAKQLGMTDENARQLAIEACKGIPWASRKFIKFLSDNTCDQLWEQDDLFKVPSELVPSKDDFERALGEIYTTRGKVTHAGRSFPESTVIGLGPMIPARAIMNMDFSSKPFPPVVWFERVVNCAFNLLLNRSKDIEGQPKT